MTFSSLVAEWP